MKTVIIRPNCDLFGKLPENVIKISPYKNNSFLIRALRKIGYKKRLFQPFINNPKLKNLQCDLIIIFDSVSLEFVRWVKKYNPNVRIIFWYWNPAYLTIDPNKIPEGIEKWSYSKDDCEKYSMEYNTTFFFRDRINGFKQLDCEYDMFFLGKDKGRREKIERYKYDFENLGLNVNFRFVSGKSDYVPYEKVLEYTLKSKCVFDYCVRDNVGMSLRSLEALYMNKKVVTNNKNYKKELLYNPNNIFILEDDDILNLVDFVNDNVDCIDDNIKDYYLFENWLARFY